MNTWNTCVIKTMVTPSYFDLITDLNINNCNHFLKAAQSHYLFFLLLFFGGWGGGWSLKQETGES